MNLLSCFIRITGFLPVSLAMISCSYPLEEMGIYENGVPARGLSLAYLQNMELNFETVKQTALKNCLECHSSGGHAMNTEEIALESIANIIHTAETKAMPPKSSGYPYLNECEMQILRTWANESGANRGHILKIKDLPACANASIPNEKPKIDFATLPLSFENLKKEILAPKCLSCHASDSPGYQYVLEDLQRIKDNDLIAATAEESTIYKVVIRGMTRIFMPPTRSGLQPLTAEEADYMKRWIDDGAKP